MKIFHIIPSAFEYFKDIKEEAFALVDEIEKIEKEGERVEADITTLQYSGPSRAEQRKLEAIVPEKEYYGEYPPRDLVNQFADYDIIHLHAPFLGGGGLIKKWKEKYPDQPLVITYYRDVLLPDLFAYFVKWYNVYYLPKLFSLADVITCYNLDDFKKSLGAKYAGGLDKVISLSGEQVSNWTPLTGDTDKVKLQQRKIAADILFQIYNSLLT